MTSETDIANLALSRLGNGPITSLDENSMAAETARFHYARTRDAVLEAHPWNFAIRRANLALDEDTPAFEYAYSFALPEDCLKVVRTDAEANGYTDTSYRIEGRSLLCDDDTVMIEYVRKETNPDVFSALFIDLLAQRLAAEMCVRLTQNASLQKGLWDVYQTKLGEARTSDAQQGTPREAVDSNGWILARL